MNEDTAMSRDEALALVHKKICKCKKCNLWKTRVRAVPGEGPADAKIMFIGLSPGKTEDEQGRPFVGRAGKLLDELLDSIKLKRKDIFITSVLRCHPPKNRLPKTEEVAACLPYLQKYVEIINPQIIVLLGNFAIKTVLGKLNGINKIHGKTVRCNGKLYFLTFHPAAGIRASRTKQKLKQDFKKLKNLFERII